MGDGKLGSSSEEERKESPERKAPLPMMTGGIAGDLRRWLIFSLLEPEFIETVRLCCVFGSSGTEALLVTELDEVWALGTNAAGCLGIGDTRSCLSPVKVPTLCGKAIQSFACGTGPHVLALTGKGEVYGWGHNGYSQAHSAQQQQVNTPELVYSDADPAVEIACGSYHSACRTRRGAVYCWGLNSSGQLGVNSTMNQQAPRKVGGPIANLKCTGISCAQSSTVAVFENGEVYAWGLNGNGQLGIGSTSHQTVPMRLEHLKNTVIRKVACGFSHTLALSDEGALWVWGANGSGQLGFDNKSNQAIPLCHSALKDKYGLINEIAASHYSQTSAVMTEKAKVLMWGQCRGQHVMVPTETPFESVHDVFGALCTVPITPVPIIVTKVWEKELSKAMMQQFDNPTFSDLKFLVDGKTIHVHKTVLTFQCEYFRTMFQGPWIENEGDTIEVTQSSYPVYKAFLRYLYTGEVNLPINEALELLDLANSCCENILKMQCQKLIKNGISIDNCATIYMAAVRYNADDLEDFCFRFAMNHSTAVVQSSAFENLPEDVYKKFISRAAKEGAFKH